jgi:peptidoglycan/xylan/chitin deacetylase (PgdA/CDA1 family)/GT2 family glycosyltransferase
VATVTEVSVIVPTRGRSRLVSDLLESLARQSVDPGTCEVIVVMDGPDEETKGLLERNPPVDCRLIENPSTLGPAAARNRGAEAAGGRLLLFLDDDMVAGPGLVRAHLAAQRGEGRLVTIGSIGLTVDRRASGFTRYFEQTWSRRYRQFEDGSRVPGWRDSYGGNLCLARELFLEVGGFDPDLPRSHDVELGHRLANAGATFVFVPEAASTERSERTFAVTASHFERAGAGEWKLYERHPAMLEETELGFPWEPKPFSAAMLSFLLRARPPVSFFAAVDRMLGSKIRHRWHGLLARYFYWCGVAKTVDKETLRRLLYGTPILLYHAFGDDGERPSRYIVPAKRFARQLNWLGRRGYNVITLDEYVATRARHEFPQAKTVVITIDDAYRDNFDVAWPLLSQRKLAATLFVVTGRVGLENNWSANDELVARPLVSWEQLEAMVQSGGVTLGAHTRTHPRLTVLDTEDARSEIQGSRDDLHEHSGAVPATFAFPYGLLNDELLSVTDSIGFAASCSVRPGLNRARTPLQALRRAEIKGTDSFFRFVLAVRFGDPDALFSRRR